MNRLLKKWAFLSVAAAAVVIGCGGNGGSKGGGTTATAGTTGIPGTNLRVNLPSNDVGAIQFFYLTGQGRATGDLVAYIHDILLEDEYGSVNSPGSGPGASFNLVTFNVASFRLDVPFSGQNSRLFASYELRFDHFSFEGSNARLNPPANPSDFEARIRVFPGRDTTVPIFLDDSMFAAAGGDVTFDPDRFTFLNESGSPMALQSFLGDYVEFDISGLASTDQPQLLDGSFGERFLISGDNYAIAHQTSGATPADGAGEFEVMTEDQQRFTGTFGPEHTIGAYTPGTYTLYQTDPSDINGIAKIVSIAGSWRSTHRVLSTPGAFEVITFPTIKDDAHHEMVAASFDANGNATALYYGFLNYDLGKFELHPVKTITDPTDFSGTLTGTISGYTNGSGSSTASPNAVRYGHYAFDTGQTMPAGFANSGTFVVFRK